MLYHEIVSHARVVSSCIRAAEKEQQLQLQQQQQQLLSSQQQQPASLTSNCSSESTSESAATKSSSLSSGFASDPVTTPISAPQAAAAAAPSKKGEGNLERLRDRYHLLYLKAFELQLCLDNLLRKRSSAAVSPTNLLSQFIDHRSPIPPYVWSIHWIYGSSTWTWID